MAYGHDDRRTIFALASGFGKAAIAIIRISGPDCAAAVAAIAGPLPHPRLASLRKLIDPESRETIDEVLLLWFPAPGSFTGEDSAELHVHGSRAVVMAVLATLGRQRGLRLAWPGEFTRRALENGKMDLIAVEALGDLIDAETEQQRRSAIHQAEGGLRQKAEMWRAKLLDCLVLIESDLDFSDEADAPQACDDKVRSNCRDVLSGLAELSLSDRQAERLRDGLTVLIVGPPNAGKSTLLNAIARREAAIVSERAGTTRDLIEVKLDLGGFPVNLFDTAGIRESEDPVEQEGINRALKKSQSADLVLWLSPLKGGDHLPPKDLKEKNLWLVMTKADEVNGSIANKVIGSEIRWVTQDTEDNNPIFHLSAKTGYKLDQLVQSLEEYAKRTMPLGESVIVANERQRRVMIAAQEALEAALDSSLPMEILAEELRQACFHLESLIGKVGVEDVLEEIFGRFCIGK